MSESKYFNLSNPLRRDGTSQNQRQPMALNPDYIKIDDRTLQEFLVYAQKFARQVYYYNDANNIEGDWEDFWSYDISVIIAAIERTNPHEEKLKFFQVFNSQPTVEGLLQLFNIILNVARKLDQWSLNITSGNELQDLISRLIKANLGLFLKQIAAYNKGAYFTLGIKLFPEPDPNIYTAFSSLWNLVDWDEIETDVSLFKDSWEPAYSDEPPPNTNDNEKLIIAYEKLKASFNQVYNVYFQVIRKAAVFFDNSLLLNDHEPHIALFIAFLRLYQKVQGDINQFTDKHLNFYLKDVLQLKLKPSIPDKVHLYFLLANHVDEYKLTKDTRFLAGNDATGEDLFYTLDNDIVINKAQLDSMFTIFVDRKDEIVHNIHASPIANSEDGLGAEISDEEKPSWMTLGSNKMPAANIGFAIASSELLLSEGTRKITLTIDYNIPEEKQLPTVQDLGDAFKISLSGAKEWIKPLPDNIDITNENTTLILTITLNPDAAAVVPFNEEVFKEKLGTTLPVMKVLARQPSGNSSNHLLDSLKDIEIKSLTLATEVDGATDLLGFNDTGALDISKSFLPFGSSPEVGSSFYLGSKEAFQKELSTITLNISWEGLPNDFENHYLGYDVSAWVDGESKLSRDDFKVDIYKMDNSENNEPIQTSISLFSIETISLGDKIFDYDDLDDYGLKSRNGFLRFDLKNNFGQDQYPQILTRQAIATAWLPKGKTLPGAFYYGKEGYPKIIIANSINQFKEVAGVVPTSEPYTPTIKSITLNYYSKVTLDNSSINNTQFIHLHPFANTYQLFETVYGLPLIPQIHKNTSSIPTTNIEGSLLLGIKNLQAKQSLSILFQVAENTADANVNEAIVQWQYLSENYWKDFKEYEITNDTTKSLTTSGIITFTIPEAKLKENTILPADLYWLKAWVEKDSGAVCETINIHTQATKLTFQNNNNDPGHLNAPLPAQTISKLEKDDSAIDSIIQDYDSFGGRMAEEPIKFYTRVSEHLRHKGRAITIYDYERIVLEQFPDIYKVKCISHTNKDDNLAPGHVLIAVIPDFIKLKAVDRSQPKVTLGRLNEIREYLETLNTTFVGTFSPPNESMNFLYVVNPSYIKLRVNFNVRFMPEITAIDFHILKLKKAIIRHLSPWAYDDAAEINFGGKIFKSSIIAFVNDQEYVDFVTDFKMLRSGSNTDVNYIESDTARTILIPDDEDKIEIFPITEANHCSAENQISGNTLGYITINDFTIKNNN